MGQQETGMLPKQLTPMDMQILKDAVLDDIFDFEYFVLYITRNNNSKIFPFFV